MVRKFSELTLDSTPGAGSYVPYVDPTEASTADRNKRLLVSDLEGADGAPGAGALPDGWIDASVYGVDPAKIDLWTAGSPPPESDSTADFQAAFDALSTAQSTEPGGVTIVFPKGRYVMLGTVTISSMTGAGPVFINMNGVEILHKPQTADPTSMFRTSMPTDNDDAEVLNGVRDFWTWYGGWYDGDRLEGQIGFEWNAVSRLIMDRVEIRSFDENVRGRFCLHFKMTNSRISSSLNYGVRIEVIVSGTKDWTGATAANSASNGTIFDNVRFFGRETNVAQLKVAHSAHTVMNCTFEGDSPDGYNYIFENGNTSCLTSKFENCWIENNAVMGHLKIDTMHQFDMDLQYSNSSQLVADIIRASLVRVYRMPWPSLGGGAGSARFSVLGSDPPDVQRISFFDSGVAGVVDPSVETIWKNGIQPQQVTARSGQYFYSTFGSGGNRGKIWRLGPPDTGGVLNDTVASVWTLVYVPANPVNTVLPAITGTATSGSTLTVSDGTWTGVPAPTFTYQWTRDAVDIAGATASTYLLVGADVGTTVACKVTGANEGYFIGDTVVATATGVAVS